MDRTVSLDILTPDGSGMKAHGSVAQRLLQNNFNVNALRTLDVLRKEEWISFDERVIEVARKRLVGINDLQSRGLTMDIANALGTTRVEWETVSDMDPAEVSMAGVTAGERDRVVFALQNVPLPIVHKDFRINIRALEASRKLGQTLDTTMVGLATRLVTERLETILFNGLTLTAGGGTVFGYTTATNRNTGSLTGDWFLTAQTGEIILGDILTMIDVAIGDNMHGPYGLYIPRSYFVKMLEDFKANSDKSMISRIMEIPDLEFIRLSKDLSDGGTGEVLLVQMTSDVVDLIDGIQPTLVEWETEGGMITNFKVMAIMIPRMKDDAALQSGIVHYSV